MAIPSSAGAETHHHHSTSLPEFRCWKRAAFAVATLCIACGCGRTAINEQRVIQARTGTGEVAYYRLRISGDATLAKSHFRAGLYDAEAIDSLVVGSAGSSSLSSETASQQLEAERTKAVVALARKYTEELLKGGDDHKTTAERLLGLLRFNYATPKGEVTFKPEKRYVIIFSAIASVVEEAIASFGEEKETQQLVVASVAPERRSEYLKEASRAQRLGAKIQQLRLLRDELQKLEPNPKATPAEKTAYLSQLRQLIDDAATTAETK